MENNLNWTDFEKVDMRVGTIVDVRDFPEARNPSYQLTIDFGPELGVKKSSAQITSLYSKEELEGKQVIAVVNFPKKQIGPFMSECLVLGAVNGKDVTLLEPNKTTKNGLRIS
jgi:tRNA-binding protein